MTTTRTPRARASRRPAARLSVEESRAVVAASISEKAFQAQVLELALRHHWLAYHPFNSRNSPAGYPDLTFVRPPRLFYAELKREGYDLTPIQRIWNEAINACGVPCYLWHPSDWDRIEATLR